MTGIFTAIAFIIIFSALVLIHEIGHFFAARKAKIKVEEFGLGLPPRAKTLWKDKMGTIFSLNWIPFGGFVKMLGEDATDPKLIQDPNSFANKSIWQRFSVIVAGVTMNFILAIFLFTIAFIIGMKPFILSEADFKKEYLNGNIIGTPQIIVNEIQTGSPAENAGLKKEDLILKINNQDILFAEEVSLLQKEQTSVVYTIQRGEDVLDISLQPNQAGKVGIGLSAGFDIIEIKKIQYPFYQAPWEAIKISAKISVLTVQMFGDLLINLTQFIMPKDVAGPVGIVQMTHKIVELGEFVELIKFAALLSVSLAVINILPFPALDGGRLLFIIYEAIFRRKASAELEATIHGFGYLFLMGLILIITWNDLDRLLNFSVFWEKIITLF